MNKDLRSFIRKTIQEQYSNLPDGYKENDSPNIEVQDYEFNNDRIIVYSKNHEPVSIEEYDIMEFLREDDKLKNILQDYLEKHPSMVQPKEKSDNI
jgi:hypothetical protein